MILPVLVAAAVGAVVRYAVKEGIEYVVEKARDKVVQEIVEKARKLAEEKLIEEARKACPTCDPEDTLKKMTDPCSALEKGDGSGPYRGGSHRQMKKPVGDGKDSHHIPAKSNYPSWQGMSKSERRKAANKWPAVQFDPKDHKQTFSYGSGTKSRAFSRAQKFAFKKYGMLGAFALDAAEIKMKFGDKYDEALKEAGMYAACVSAFPDKYNTKPKSGKRRKR